MYRQARRMRDEEGFTLIELLITITILGILAGIVVFAVSGITDKGQTSACTADRNTLLTAQQAYYAKQTGTAVYGNEFELKTGGVIGSLSTLYDVTVGASQAAADAATNAETSSVTGAFFSIKVQSANCGTAGTRVYP